MTNLTLFIDGQAGYNVKPQELNFAQGLYINAYMTLFSGLDKLYKDEGNDISRDEYANGFACSRSI